MSPEVVGLSSNPLTTSCVRHCAKGEGGAKRERRLRGTEGGWQKDKVQGSPEAQCPTGASSSPHPPGTRVFSSNLLRPGAWSQFANQAALSYKPKGALPALLPSARQLPTSICPPTVAPLQRRWTLVASQASWQGHLVPQPWHSPSVWASRAEDGWLGGSPGTHG